MVTINKDLWLDTKNTDETYDGAVENELDTQNDWFYPKTKILVWGISALIFPWCMTVRRSDSPSFMALSMQHFYDNTSKDKTVFYVHTVGFTGSELQVVVVIFLNDPFSRCRRFQLGPFFMHAFNHAPLYSPLFTFMKMQSCGKSIYFAIFFFSFSLWVLMKVS